MVPTTTDYNVGVLKTACDAQWNKNGERSCNMYVSKQFDKALHIRGGLLHEKKRLISLIFSLCGFPLFSLFLWILEHLEILYT